MKQQIIETAHRQQERQLRTGKKYRLAILLVFLITSFGFTLNTKENEDLPFAPGEKLNYDIKFKWGILMAKAGTASYSLNNGKYDNKAAIKTTLTFRTSSTFDKIFKVRDTLYSYTDIDTNPLFHKKHLHEGNTHYVEELTYKHYSKKLTKARSIRYKNKELRFDSLLVSNGFGIDMLSIFVFARTLNYSELKPGDRIPLSVFVGRDVVKMSVLYVGQEILEKNTYQKYKTLKFNIDIVDNTFEDNKNAMEMWVTDDKNRIPVKLKAKLKIGAAEAHLSSHSGNKYPLSSLITIPN